MTDVDLAAAAVAARFSSAKKAHACLVVCQLRVPYHAPMQRILVVIGAIFLLAGLLWPWLSKLGLGRLPGDIRVESESGGFYFPITTCVIVSIVVSLIIWFIRR